MIIAQNYLTQKIDELIINKEIESNKVRKQKNEELGPRLHPSSISKCSRWIWYDMMGYPRPIPITEYLKNGEAGNDMHDRYQTWFKELGILVDKEIPFKFPELRVSMRVDAVIDATNGFIPNINDLVVVELKSCNQKKFNMMLKDNQPLPKYVDQVMFYMGLLEMPYGLVYVECRNDQKPLEYLVEYDQQHVDALLGKARYVNEHVTAKKLPRRDYPRNSFDCRFCDYADICWGKSVT